MAFEVKPAESPRSLWPFLAMGVAVVILLVLLFGWAAQRSAPRGEGEARLPFGAAEQSYAARVQFENLQMSRFANILNQEVTYLAGDIVNRGNRTVADVQVIVEFRNAQNQVVLRETEKVLGSPPVAIEPGGRRSFQLGFEAIPSDWNMKYPSIRVTGLALH